MTDPQDDRTKPSRNEIHPAAYSEAEVEAETKPIAERTRRRSLGSFGGGRVRTGLIVSVLLVILLAVVFALAIS